MKEYFESNREYKFIADGETGLCNIRCGDRYEIIALDEEDDCYGYQWIITSAVCIESVAVRMIRQFLKGLKVKGLTQKRTSKLLGAYDANALEEIIANSSALAILNPSPELRNRIYAAVTSKQIFVRIMKFLYDLFTREIAQFQTADRVISGGRWKNP